MPPGWPNQQPTDEQQAVLDSVARLTVVGATAGSGKTFVFAEKFQQLLACWRKSNQGIAALSFTNVAQHEITNRLGGHPGSPHFVGTLDSFLFRYVVRPFGHLVGLPTAGPELIASPLDMLYEQPRIWFGQGQGKQAPVYRVRFVDESQGLALRVSVPQRPDEDIDSSFVQAVLQGKKEHWGASGRVTHSDVHYLAAEILRLPVHGERVAGLIARRFPVILVDELQDTGWFLGQSLVRLLRRTDVRGMTVGDPDQAIYEFSGADPGLFDTIKNLDGAREYPIETTRRCSARICRVATALSSVNRHVTEREGAPAGHAVLLVHNDDSPQGDGIIAQRVIELKRAGVDIMILARTNNLVNRFRQEDESSSPELKAATRNLHRAAIALRAGKSHDAVGIVATLLSKLVLGGSSPTLVVLRNHGIEPREWRRSIWQVLRVSIGTDGQSWGTWRDHVKAAVRTEAQRLGPGVSNQVLGSNFQIPSAATNTSRPSMTAAEESARLRCPADTVHGAKGREFDVVLLYVQRPHAQHAPCPSTAWWDNPEARRVAFVAATRARNTLVVCVHRQTYDRLVQNRADFVSLFDIVEEV